MAEVLAAAGVKPQAGRSAGALVRDSVLGSAGTRQVLTGAYVKFTLEVKISCIEASWLLHLMDLLREAGGEWWGAPQFGIVSKRLATLILVGGEGTMTGLHVDWTEAKNLAFSLGKVRVT